MKGTLVLLAWSIACSKGDSDKEWPNPKSTTPTEVPGAGPTLAPAPPPVVVDDKVEVHVSANGVSMTFEPTKITIPAGKTVHLVFENKPPGSLPHNWALVTPSTEATVAAAGLEKGQAANYVAEGPNVLAYTALAMPGKTSEVTFKAPAVGTYPYICTFPGHYMMMKGVLVVTP
jgi:azurin